MISWGSNLKAHRIMNNLIMQVYYILQSFAKSFPPVSTPDFEDDEYKGIKRLQGLSLYLVAAVGIVL